MKKQERARNIEWSAFWSMVKPGMWIHAVCPEESGLSAWSKIQSVKSYRGGMKLYCISCFYVRDTPIRRGRKTIYYSHSLQRGHCFPNHKEVQVIFSGDFFDYPMIYAGTTVLTACTLGHHARILNMVLYHDRASLTRSDKLLITRLESLISLDV